MEKQQKKRVSHKLLKKRQERLSSEGFLDREVKFFAQYPISSYEIARIRRYRRKEVRQAIKKGIPEKKLKRYIYDSYVANDWVDDKGFIRPDVWSSRAFSELELPRKERSRQVLLAPETYTEYKQIAKEHGFSKKDTLKLVSIVKPTKYAERMLQYKYLRDSYFTHAEAYAHITATYRDKEGKIHLQSLDLKNHAWQMLIQERINYVKDQLKHAEKEGISRYKAIKIIVSNINKANEESAGKKSGKTVNYDWLVDYYRWKRENKNTDFSTGMRKRAERMKKQHLPFRVRR